MVGKTSFSNTELALFSSVKGGGRDVVRNERRFYRFVLLGTCRHWKLTGVDSSTTMHFASNKMTRVTLAVSVSFWITGAACLWGCNNNALAATALEQHQIQGTLTRRSCHSSKSNTHHCCSRKSSNVASDAQLAHLGGAELST